MSFSISGENLISSSGLSSPEALWATANALTVFAIRDVGLSIAFPSLEYQQPHRPLSGEWLLFGELTGAGRKQIGRVLGGAAAIAAGACILALTASAHSANHPHSTAIGITAALGAALLWGTMLHPLP